MDNNELLNILKGENIGNIQIKEMINRIFQKNKNGIYTGIIEEIEFFPKIYQFLNDSSDNDAVNLKLK
jgi:hypothetical protein